MLSMESVATSQTLQDSHNLEEEDGEILEDGEIDDEDTTHKGEFNLVDSTPSLETSNYVVEEVVEQVYEEEEEEAVSEDEEKKKHRKRSHHRRRKKHDDRRSEEKSKHKKRKGEDGSDGGDSPPSKRKKKKKKHSKDKKERESTSPENASQTPYDSKRLSESPPLPSEQSLYGYEYNPMNTYNNANNYNENYESSAAFTDTNNSATYSYDTEQYQQNADYSSGSDSYYSDFESHLKQYQSYKQNKDTKNDPDNNNRVSGDNDDDNYYSVGYDSEKRRGRHRSNDDVRSNRRTSHRIRSGQNSGYDEKRRSSKRESKSSIASREEQSICRYFKEGHCGKGDKCIYSHQLNSHRNKDGSTKKIPELCHHYMHGYCQLGDQCNYMHEDYPCKYFHTGTQCFDGEKCKFSHDPATELTRPIIQQFQDAFNSIDDTKEIEALEKAGLKPLQKPPPGRGLLPTPPSALPLIPSAQMPMKRSKGKKIPSLFDIKVQPTAELQQKIDANVSENNWIEPGRVFCMSTVTCLQMVDDVRDPEDVSSQAPNLPMPAPMFDPSHGGGGLLPLPSIGTGLLRPPIIPNFPPPNFIGAPQGPPPQMMMPVPPVTGLVPPNILPPGSATPPWIQRQKALLQQQQEEAKEFYDQFYAKSTGKQTVPNLQSETTNNESEKTTQDAATRLSEKTQDASLSSIHHDEIDEPENEDNKNKEDIIRMDDDGDVIKDPAVKAPDFLPAKQKALFMRIHQKRTLSNENETPSGHESEGRKEISTDNWTYSSDEDDVALPTGQRPSSSNAASSESVQSIIKMISNKKTDSDATVDTNLLSKVANVISLPATVSGLSHSNRMTYTSNSQAPGKGMMSPPRQPHHRNERKGSNAEASPRHNPLRRRLSTSELNKEPVTIPLVVKQNTDSMHVSHPDPRMTLSRLFGKSKPEFRGSLPGFGKDVMMPGSGKMTGLKITLSSHNASSELSGGDKRSDPRLSHRSRPGDPRMKSKPNDPRLRMRASSATKTSPPRSPLSVPAKTSIPTKPTALLTKPPTSIIPSLPELNLDLATIQDHKKKSPKQSESPVATKIGDPLAGLPKLMRGNVRSSSNNHMVSSSSSTSKQSPAPAIAPYDPRYITAGASTSTTTALSSSPAPYDPRATTTQISNVPPLFDPRAANKDVKKRTIQLPKLTPAPGYAAKVQESNGNSHPLPSGEQEDF